MSTKDKKQKSAPIRADDTLKKHGKSAGEGGGNNKVDEEISSRQLKSQRKLQNQQAEAERLRARELMERMTLSDEEEETVFVKVTTHAKKIEAELGGNGGFRDAFGNTTKTDPSKSLEEKKRLERMRAEARERREAKFKAEQEEAEMKKASKGNSAADSSEPLTRKQEIEAIQQKAANGEVLSNKEKKLLKKYEQEQAEEAEMVKEFSSGLSSFSLSIGGRAAAPTYDSDDEGGDGAFHGEDGEEEEKRTLSATDVIVPCFSISAPHRLLFHDAMLRLVSGRRYGLLGPNGRGKTTLLKYIAARQMPVPPGVSVLMLEQEVAASEVSVVDQVLSADTQRSKLLSEEAALLAFLDSTLGKGSVDEDAGGGVDTEEAILHDQHVDAEEEEEGESSDKKKRSAGKKKPSKDSKDRSVSIGAVKTALDLPIAVERLQTVGAELDAMDAYKSESKARKILTGLGFTDAMQNAGSTTLSGGWRVRVSLAKALFMEPHLLLLDEPTNHLDIDAVIWLDDYLSTCWKGTLLIVSHDCDFLDSVCTNIIHLDEMKLNYYTGNVTTFEKMKGQILSKKTRMWKLQQKTLKEFETQGLSGEKAKKRAAEKLNVPELMAEEPREYRVNFSFKCAEDSTPTISVLEAGFRYPGTPRPLFHQLRFNICTDSRVAIVGANGSGKSTLLKLLTGKLEPTEGHISFHRNLRIGVYDQHFEDVLPVNMSAMEYLTTQYESVTENEARKYLGMFGLDGARHLIKMGNLSGGQKARVVFASLAVQKPHILILDECTNHLDLESVDALIRALKEFRGGVMLVSHDARLISAIECEIWVCEGGLEDSEGITGTGLRVERKGFEQYRKEVIKKIAKKALLAERLAEERAAKRKEQRERKLRAAANAASASAAKKVKG